MNGMSLGRTESFSMGAMETKYPTLNLQPTPRFQPTSVFDQAQVRGSSNGLGAADYDRKRLGGGFAPTQNGTSLQTYDQRVWLDKNPYRTIGG